MALKFLRFLQHDIKSRKYAKSSILPHFSYCIVQDLPCNAKQMLQKPKQNIFLQILSRAACQEQTASQLEQPEEFARLVYTVHSKLP